MIITRTPVRISFVGGGSDLPEFYRQHGGAVLSTTIDKYMYVSTHPFFDDPDIRIKYAKTETVSAVDQIQHPIVREVLHQFSLKAIEISSNADIPAGCGLGSSSSFTASLLLNCFLRSGNYPVKEELARRTCEIEIDKLGEPIGKQDQYAIVFGGLNVIEFRPDDRVSVEPVVLPKHTLSELQQNLLMFYTGTNRKAGDVLGEQKKNIEGGNYVDIQKQMVGLTWQARDALFQSRLKDFGKLLHENWLLKRQLASGVTNSFVDEAYETGIRAGALGGKLLGAGGGGFLLFYCEPDSHDKIRAALKHLKELRFQFEFDGAKVLYGGDEND